MRRISGGEFVRVNVDAYLRQEVVDKESGEVTFKGRLKDEGSKIYERDLVANGAKWWAVKSQQATFSGIGSSSQWRLVIDSLSRVGFVIPEEGIPFSAVLTISDPDQGRPIFNEMRAQLQNNGVNITDIKTAARFRVR